MPERDSSGATWFVRDHEAMARALGWGEVAEFYVEQRVVPYLHALTGEQRRAKAKSLGVEILPQLADFEVTQHVFEKLVEEKTFDPLFVTHCPKELVPLAKQNRDDDSLVDVYRNSEIFQGLHSPDQFHGKCGICEYSHICGGSRARAFAYTGDALGTDPFCPYEPTSEPRGQN